MAALSSLNKPIEKGGGGGEGVSTIYTTAQNGRLGNDLTNPSQRPNRL